MLDLKYVRANADAVRKNAADRAVDVDVDAVIALYDSRNDLIQRVETLRTERNDNARAMKAKLEPEERSRLIDEGRRIKEEITRLEEELTRVKGELDTQAARLPNMTHPDAPIGPGESANRVVEVLGTPTAFAFQPRDHVEIATDLDLVDFETAARVSGPKFYYLKNEAVFLELALSRFALDIVQSHGFTPTITPDIAKTEIVSGIGFSPRGPESNIYALEGENACLVGTAEITLGGYHAGHTFSSDDLPVRLAGLSHCFRREAGSAGQFSRGLYRVHQFSKVEMFVYAMPDQSEEIHAQMVGIEKEIFERLEIPFRVVDIGSGDLGGPAYRKFDIEAWMPGRGDGGEWGEVTSASNCTDYQSRRLGIRYTQTVEGRKERGFVHLLNGTAVAVSRAIIAILENHQRADGSVAIPEALAPYTGFARIDKRL